AEDCQRAFNRFWRGPASSQGSGLGLAIVQQLAQASGAVASLTPKTVLTALGQNQPASATGLDACVRFKAAGTS
ncbi:MAG: two-component sensor histidine kinase, partial [Arthrobacter sp.]|nr:two-component sensor histidine kinase [Arthrobacter sp.]